MHSLLSCKEGQPDLLVAACGAGTQEGWGHRRAAPSASNLLCVTLQGTYTDQPLASGPCEVRTWGR